MLTEIPAIHGEQRLPLALCVYSLPHVMGYLPTKDGQPIATPMTPNRLLQRATEWGLSGVEFPLTARVPSFEGAIVEAPSFEGDLAAALQERRLGLIADYGALLSTEGDHLCRYLAQAASVGVRVVRATLSHILCGDRRNLQGGWYAYREELALRIREVLPHAEALGVCLAVENHQDATSDDLLWLAEQTGFSPSFGVTLDAGNPLAVGEEPIEFAQRIAPLIRHVHLKDYTMHIAPEGYRLVRCAAGEGVVDFPAILQIVRNSEHSILPAIEIAAQATRTIPMLEATWWEHYPSTSVTRLIPALRLLWEKGNPADKPYSSAWERGAGSEEVAEEELRLVVQSIDYFRSIL